MASEPQWMNIKKLSDIIANFNRQVDNRVELVFFQNCKKGTIEDHYTFRDTAKYTLSSQIMLGAPNYYYEPMLQFLGREPDINGGELAKMIMEFERSDMYHSYTVTNNHAVFALPAIIIPLINSVIASSKNDIQLSEVNLFHYMDNRFVDVISFFKTITKQSGADMEIYKKIVKYIKNSMIYNFKQNGKLLGSRAKYYQNLSGLNSFLPTSRQEFDKYRYLPVFSELKLAELFNAILFN